MTPLERIISLFAPFDCMFCEREGSPVCQDCFVSVPTLSSRCYRCWRPTEQFRVCGTCTKTSTLGQVWIRTAYQGQAKDMVKSMKFDRNKAMTEVLAKMIISHFTLPVGALLVPITTVGQRRRIRGYDQSPLISQHLSKLSGLPYLNVLNRLGAARQVGASRTERVQQLQNAYLVSEPKLVAGKHIILVDDVVTTGATLEAAARVLVEVGAGRVDAVVFAAA